MSSNVQAPRLGLDWSRGADVWVEGHGKSAGWMVSSIPIVYGV